MAYIYIHKRKTDGSVFYVGKGRGYRVTRKAGRSDWWHRTVSKYGYTWELTHRGLTDEEAYVKEMEVIRYYRDMGAELVNMNEGGEGNSCGLASEFPELYPAPYLNVKDLRSALPDWWHNGCNMN